MKQLVAALVLLASTASAALAHHSYVMYDSTGTVTVTGTVAKLEWTNPHVSLWVYVPSSAAESGFDLYAFENGSPNVLSRRGWSKTMFTTGEKISIEYWPLLDGRTGGHLHKVTRADGSTIRGAGGPRGVDGTDSPAPSASAGP